MSSPGAAASLLMSPAVPGSVVRPLAATRAGRCRVHARPAGPSFAPLTAPNVQAEWGETAFYPILINGVMLSVLRRSKQNLQPENSIFLLMCLLLVGLCRGWVSAASHTQRAVLSSAHGANVPTASGLPARGPKRHPNARRSHRAHRWVAARPSPHLCPRPRSLDGFSVFGGD